MNHIEAMKQALAALESCSTGDYSTGHVIHPSFDVDAVNKAIEAIREALAERCVCGEPDTPGTHRTDAPCLAEQPTVKQSLTVEQPAQQQEPVSVARVDDLERGGRVRALAMGLSLDAPLYISPQPSKPWVGLTDKEIGVLWFEANDQDNSMIKHFARAIETKLREKNGGAA